MASKTTIEQPESRHELEHHQLVWRDHPLRRKGPVVLCILDGFGVQQDGQNPNGDCVTLGHLETVERLKAEARTNGLYCLLGAHGPAVGLGSDDDMGNSEVGHNAIGCGQIYAQGAKLVSMSLATKALFGAEGWSQHVRPFISTGSAAHFFGLLSDGNVHSHIDHLKLLIRGAVEDGCKKIRVHPLLDGRDVPPTSGLKYIDDIEENLRKVMEEHPDVDARIASGSGRMVSTMDRYEGDWGMVHTGVLHMIHGAIEDKWIGSVEDASGAPVPASTPEQNGGYRGYYFSAKEAIEHARQMFPNAHDQFNPPFVIVRERTPADEGVWGVDGVDVAGTEGITQIKKGLHMGGKFVPVAMVQKDDVMVNFNFRGDRALEISRTLDWPAVEDASAEDTFPKFSRAFQGRHMPKIHYVGILQYDSDAKIPINYLLPPPPIANVMNEYLLSPADPSKPAPPGFRAPPFHVLEVAETHKFGHVTYFFNGNRAAPIGPAAKEGDIPLESRVEIPSHPPSIPLNHVPEMKASEVCDVVCKAIREGAGEGVPYDFIVVNFANPDMVGHTGDIPAVIRAVQECDRCVKRILEAIDEVEGVLLLTADHGNAEQELDGGKHADGTWGKEGEKGVMVKTSHTLNPVPFAIHDPAYAGEYHVIGGYRFLDDRQKCLKEGSAESLVGISNLASTVINLLGFEAPPFYERSLLKFVSE